jgi:hypothetical protein
VIPLPLISPLLFTSTPALSALKRNITQIGTHTLACAHEP